MWDWWRGKYKLGREKESRGKSKAEGGHKITTLFWKLNKKYFLATKLKKLVGQ